MSIDGLTCMARLTLTAGGVGTILTLVLYKKLQIRKACSILWGLPMKNTVPKEPKKPKEKAIQEEQQTELLMQDTQVLMRDKGEMKPPMKTTTKYEQTYIHTQAVIE